MCYSMAMKKEISAIQTSIDEALSRGVATLIDPQGAFREKLLLKATGKYEKNIIIKFGVDPTRPDIHLGHAVVLRGLRRLQDLGAKVIFLVGDFTAQIGDPTGKSKTRPEVEQAAVEENMKSYLAQVGAILRTDADAFSWIRNSDWFYNVSDVGAGEGDVPIALFESEGKQVTVKANADSFVGKAATYEASRMQKTHLQQKTVRSITLRNFLSALRSVTHSRLVARDLFQDRLARGEELYMHEMMYPVLQGLDSHLIALLYGSCDLEVGGTDQLFNMIFSRDLMKGTGHDQQSVAAFSLLVGIDGAEKMSKSLDNYVGITDTPTDMYGKIMSIPDSCIAPYFELCTYTPLSDIEVIKKELENKNNNPRDAKMRLASEIVAIYHGEKAAKEAGERFAGAFKKGEMPDDAPCLKVSAGSPLLDVLYAAKIIESKSEGTRLMKAGAISIVSLEGEKITDTHYTITASINLRVGKHRFVKLEVV